MNKKELNILLVEDDEAHVEIIQRAFEDYSSEMKLLVADTLQKARDEIKKNLPDLVIVDMLLPDGKGVELLPGSKEEGGFPVVVMTSFGNEKIAVEAMKAGAVEYIVKSEATLIDMPHIASRALREWGYLAFRKKAEEENRRLSQAVEQSPSIVFITDTSGVIAYVNPKFTKVTGYSFDEAVGNKPHILSSGEMTDEEYKELYVTICAGKEWHGEFHNKKKNGDLYWEEASIMPIKDENGNILEFLKVAEDVTSRKEALRKTAEAIETKSQFVSMVSHELRTPLTAIKEGINIVVEGAAGEIGEKQKEFLDIAKRNVDRLSRLINNVLDYQKLESGAKTFDFGEHDVNDVIEEVQKTMFHIAKEKGLELISNLNRELPVIAFDRDKIIQVLTNIVSNAIKFTTDGSIVITISREGNNAFRVTVEDTGMGIKKENLSKLFHRFEQLESDVERKTGGSGLGLAISREIIERHRGKIWAESELGVGTAIHFVLPIKEKRGQVHC